MANYVMNLTICHCYTENDDDCNSDDWGENEDKMLLMIPTVMAIFIMAMIMVIMIIGT